MNINKRSICLLLAVLTALGLFLPAAGSNTGGFPLSAEAASLSGFDCATPTQYVKAYTLSDRSNTIPYTSPSLTTRGHENRAYNSAAIYPTDELWILDVGSTNGKDWAYVSYKAGAQRVKAYIPLSAITKANGTQIAYTSSGRFNCAARATTEISNQYYVDKGDTLIHAGTEGDRYQIIYRSGDVYRLAFCTIEDYITNCLGKPQDAVLIPENTYKILSVLENFKYAVDLAGNQSTNEGNTIYLWQNLGDAPSQKWVVKHVSGIWYAILHKDSGKAITVSGETSSSHTNVVLETYTGRPGQLFCFIPRDNAAFFTIKSALGCCLHVPSSQAKNGNWLQVVRDLNGVDAQKWALAPMDPEFEPVWPTTTGYNVTCLYFYKTGRSHSTMYESQSGIDIGVPTGTAVFAVENGVVEKVHWANTSLGNYIIIRHENGKRSLYAHLSEIRVSQDASVNRGQTIGLSGKSGTTDAHLHFELSGSDAFMEFYSSKYANQVTFAANVRSNNQKYNTDKSIVALIDRDYHWNGSVYVHK